MADLCFLYIYIISDSWAVIADAYIQFSDEQKWNYNTFDDEWTFVDKMGP